MKQILSYYFAMLLVAPLIAQQSAISGVVTIFNSEFDTGKRKYVSHKSQKSPFRQFLPER